MKSEIGESSIITKLSKMIDEAVERCSDPTFTVLEAKMRIMQIADCVRFGSERPFYDYAPAPVCEVLLRSFKQVSSEVTPEGWSVKFEED